MAKNRVQFRERTTGTVFAWKSYRSYKTRRRRKLRFFRSRRKLSI